MEPERAGALWGQLKDANSSVSDALIGLRQEAEKDSEAYAAAVQQWQNEALPEVSRPDMWIWRGVSSEDGPAQRAVPSVQCPHVWQLCCTSSLSIAGGNPRAL